MELLLLVLAVLVGGILIAGAALVAGFLLGLGYGRTFYDRSEADGTGRRQWPWLRRALRRALGRCYRIQWAPGARQALAAIPRENRLLYTGSPHGVLAASAFFVFLLGDDTVEEARGGAQLPLLGVHALLTALPGIRDIALALGAIDASWASLDAALRCGQDCALVPGGVREMVPSVFHGAGKQRWPRPPGYLRLAWHHSAHLVPVRFDDEAQLCAVLPLPAWLVQAREWCMQWRWLRYPFPLLFLPKPWRLPVVITIEKPLDPPIEPLYADFEWRMMHNNSVSF